MACNGWAGRGKECDGVGRRKRRVVMDGVVTYVKVGDTEFVRRFVHKIVERPCFGV